MNTTETWKRWLCVSCFFFVLSSFRCLVRIFSIIHVLKIRPCAVVARLSTAPAVPQEEGGASLLAPFLEQAHPLAPAVGAPQVASAR